ncbi:MAG: hypothetical protein ABEN55_02540 [Bradymonadaceae bacterium]
MSRPYELRQEPPLFGEAKHGMTHEDGYPTDLGYWRVVQRKKVNKNWVKLKDVHNELGDQPMEIPIQLASDDAKENFPGYRKLDDKGEFMCGAPYQAGDEGRMTAVFDQKTGRFVPEHRRDEFDDGRLETREAIEATRMFDRNGWTDEPQSYPCHKQCPYWQRGHDHNGPRCELKHTLYFYLDDTLPHSTKLFAYQAKATNAQKTLSGSLTHLTEMTDGILANIPLKLELRYEPKQDPSGTFREMPRPAIVPAEGFEEAIRQEIKRRKRKHELYYNESPDGLDDIRITGTLEGVHNRSALETQETRPDEPIESDTPSGIKDVSTASISDLPNQLEEAFEKSDLPPQKQRLTVERFKHDADNEEELIDNIESFLDDNVDVNVSVETNDSDADDTSDDDTSTTEDPDEWLDDLDG